MKYVLTLDVAKGKSMVMLSSEVGEVLIELTSKKETIKIKIIELAKETDMFIPINSIFSIGELSAALLIAELKDITRFNNIKGINASCGLEPSII